MQHAGWKVKSEISSAWITREEEQKNIRPMHETEKPNPTRLGSRRLRAAWRGQNTGSEPHQAVAEVIC